MSDKAIDQVLRIDTEKRRVEMIVNAIFHNILRDYTAYVNRNEIMTNLYKFFTESELTLISKVELRQYEEMKKLTLDIDMLKPNSTFMPER